MRTALRRCRPISGSTASIRLIARRIAFPTASRARSPSSVKGRTRPARPVEAARSRGQSVVLAAGSGARRAPASRRWFPEGSPAGRGTAGRWSDPVPVGWRRRPGRRARPHRGDTTGGEIRHRTADTRADVRPGPPGEIEQADRQMIQDHRAPMERDGTGWHAPISTSNDTPT